MEFFDVLHMRQSVRRYTGEKVEERDIAAIVEAAQLAPVGMHNNKGYVLTVISSKTVLDQMKRSFTEVTGKEGDPSYGAPLFILVSKTPEAIEEIAKYDAACIVENMHLAAAALGLGSVYIHGMIFFHSWSKSLAACSGTSRWSGSALRPGCWAQCAGTPCTADKRNISDNICRMKNRAD